MASGLAFANGRLGEGDADDGGAAEASADGLVEVVHVVREEAPADEAERFDFLGVVGDDLGSAEGNGGVVVLGEVVFVFFVARGATADG